LLGIDFTKYATPLPAMFESQKVPNHHDKFHTDDKIFGDIVKRVYWIDYICQMPKMFGLALNNDKAGLMQIDSSKGTHEKELGITFSLDKFKLFCIVQGFMFDTLASRYDDINHKMKIEDLGNESRSDAILSNYIKRQYHSDYQSRLSAQNKLEFEILNKELVQQLISSDTIENFVTLLSKGLTRNHVSTIISDMFKDGFSELKAGLFDPNVVCPCRAGKLRILVMGSYKDIVVYNKGNTIKAAPSELERLYGLVGLSQNFASFKDEYIKKSMHLYRISGKPNKNSHCNNKPSYWAYGHKNLGAYFKTISKDEQDEYCKVHTHCCGVWDGKVYRLA
jgi:hypothetical protein